MTSKKQRRKQGNGVQPMGTKAHSSSLRTQAAKHTGSGSRTVPASSEQTRLQKSTVFTSIELLTMDKFIACACDKDLRVLIIEGEPHAFELSMAWVNIKSQHLQNVADAQSMMQVQSMGEIIEYDWRRAEVETLLFLLSEKLTPEVVAKLQEYDFDYEFSEDSYREDMERVLAELGSEGIDVEVMRNNLYGLHDEAETTDSSTTKQSYYNTILQLQKHLGLCTGMTPMMAAKIITVYEFGTYLKEYNRMISLQNTNKPLPDGYNG